MSGDKDSCMGDEAAFEVVSVYADEGVVLKTMTVTSEERHIGCLTPGEVQDSKICDTRG